MTRETQLEIMAQKNGFIAALDQSGGSTPKTLKQYGINEDAYKTEEEMYEKVHEMRTRIITSPAFSSDYIIGAILFQKTMDRKIEEMYTADYLWEIKGIIPFLKVDQGLLPEKDSVQLMKDIPSLDETLTHARERHIFGTKMRSVIKGANDKGIKEVVKQQFEVGIKIAKAGLVPILEPEVDIHIADKKDAEEILLKYCMEELKSLPDDIKIMFKFSIPSVDGFYSELMKDSHVVRIVALSGGYSRKEADEKLEKNPGLIASFSRALLEDVSVNQTQKEFNQVLSDTVKEIYEASIK